jgi:hypothetical protein
VNGTRLAEGRVRRGEDDGIDDGLDDDVIDDGLDNGIDDNGIDALPCEPLHCPYESKSRVCEFFGIWLHFLSEWTKALLHERKVNLMCYLLGASNSVRSCALPRK